MQFTDEIYLIRETRVKNELMQYETRYTEIQTWADLSSVGAKEVSAAGQNGHKAEARASVHLEDYSGEKLVRIPEGNILLPAKTYEVYRTYQSGDVIELYLMETEGVR